MLYEKAGLIFSPKIFIGDMYVTFFKQHFIIPIIFTLLYHYITSNHGEACFFITVRNTVCDLFNRYI
jgi:hypothetical protein